MLMKIWKAWSDLIPSSGCDISLCESMLPAGNRSSWRLEVTGQKPSDEQGRRILLSKFPSGIAHIVLDQGEYTGNSNPT
jgi:hypothetical protein